MRNQVWIPVNYGLLSVVNQVWIHWWRCFMSRWQWLSQHTKIENIYVLLTICYYIENSRVKGKIVYRELCKEDSSHNVRSTICGRSRDGIYGCNLISRSCPLPRTDRDRWRNFPFHPPFHRRSPNSRWWHHHQLMAAVLHADFWKLPARPLVQQCGFLWRYPDVHPPTVRTFEVVHGSYFCRWQQPDAKDALPIFPTHSRFSI